MLICGILLTSLLVAIIRIYVVSKRRKEKELLYDMELLVKEKTEMTGLIGKLHDEAKSLSFDNQKLLYDNYALKNEEDTKLMHESYLIENIFKSINDLHADYYIYGNSDKVRGKLLSCLSKQIKFLREDNVILTAMEGHVNNFHSNLLSDVFGWIGLTSEQRRIVAFRCLRFSREVICNIMGLSIDNYHSRLYRLKKRIAECGSPRRDELLGLLYNDNA